MSERRASASSGTTICPVPSHDALFVVTIDGKAYAGFVDRRYAERAVEMWRGEIDGAGAPIPAWDRERRAWPAVRGRKLDIVER
jgi:hypothetical protein